MSRGVDLDEIGIVLYPGAQMAAVHGLTDLLCIASRFSREARPDGGTPLRVSHWSSGAAGDGGMSCVYRSEPHAVPRPGFLVLPPTLAGLPDPETCARIGRWLHGQHERGVGLATVCSGVFLVAGTGLLDGRVVSTHRNCATELTERHPKIAVDLDQRMIDHADVLTAGGFMAWVDVGLELVERTLGDAVRARTARFILSDPAARPAAGFVPRLTHGDPAVRRAQEFIHVRDGQGVSLASIGAAARLERRTLLRRFTAATGMTPIEYCRAVRIERARELLEAGTKPLKEIAGTLGYADLSSFTRAFRAVHGLPPGAWRERHGGRYVGQAVEEPDPDAPGSNSAMARGEAAAYLAS